MNKRKLILLCIVAVLSAVTYIQENFGTGQNQSQNQSSTQTSTADLDYSKTDQLIEKAYQNQQSDLQVAGEGRVIKVLADDLDGSRHQKFILKLSSGRTVLFAHNIDLAPRVDNLREGDQLEFYGEYEWNDRGGVIHWTHHDPRGKHADGWLRHNGKTYQ